MVTATGGLTPPSCRSPRSIQVLNWYWPPVLMVSYCTIYVHIPISLFLFESCGFPNQEHAHIPGPKHPLSQKLACGRWWASRVCWARTLRRRNRRGRPTSPNGTTRCAFSLVNWVRGGACQAQIAATARRSQGLNPCRCYQPAACTRHDKAELSAIAFECWRTAAPMPQVPFMLTSFALSLLLVFRTNNSYDRCAALVQSWPGPCVFGAPDVHESSVNGSCAFALRGCCCSPIFASIMT